MIRVLALDMDGVLRHWDPAEDHAYEDRYGLPHGTLGGLLVEEPHFGEVLRGRLRDEELYASMRERALARFGPRGPEAVLAWAGDVRCGYLDSEVVALVQAARSMLETAILSNTSSRLFGEVEHLGVVELFDHVVPSSLLGYAKPEPQCFLLALERFGVEAEECVFVDDSLRNVEAAAALGIHAVHFAGTRDLLDRLSALGVRVP